MIKFNLSLFIFRRDLRLEDNTALTKALELSKKVICIFIYDPCQISDQNIYKSDNAIQFMNESLKDLNQQLKQKGSKLYLFNDEPEIVIANLIKELKFDAIFLNEDYTPFSLKRDLKIKELCIKNNIKFHSFEDVLLIDPKKFMSLNGTPYSIFTPFFKKASKQEILKPAKLNFKNFYNQKINLKESKIDFKYKNTKSNVQGSRSQVLKILKNVKKFKNYANEKDFPFLETTNLSAYLKFGVCSIREAYYAIEKQFGNKHALIRQLFWRDFFTYIAYHSPFIFEQPFKEKYEKLKWIYDSKKFELWCNGQTGFPIIDAGMRQLNETGYMHNRVRLITASFLVKDLHINWQLGEKYFAQKLIDYDPAVNNGNWQWVASTGADSTPYFRIFNPWLQQKKFDPNCEYIKKWVKELKNVDSKIIHRAYENKIKGYPKPIIEHKIEAAKALKFYKNL